MTPSPASGAQIPRPGLFCTVRNRRGVVAGVEPFDGEGGRLHLVHVEYKDDQLPVEEQLLWELEPHKLLLEPTALPDPSRSGPMPADDFDALLRAARWTAAMPFLDPDGSGPLERLPIRSPFHGAVQVEDYQLVPLLKALRMPRVNLLLADDVGLGKTIEAGLILSELLIRRRIQRVLILTPASLRLQWRDEMWDKFSLRFNLVDRDETATLRRRLGMDANPWRSFSRIIASYHYLRQDDVLDQFMAACQTPPGSPHLPWDLLIVDECHNLMPSPFGEDSDLCRMVRLLAPRFEHRLFLSATPHNGHTRSFTAADAYKRAKAAFEAVHVEYAGLEASWRAGRAAALAGDLVDGEPCQVCGSTAHPTPARSADEVDDAALDEARERLEEARRLQDGSKDDLSQSEADVSTARGEFKALRDAVPEGLTTVQANADARACEDEVMKLVEAVAAVPDPDEVTATANEAIDTAEKRLTAAQKADRGAASDLAGKRASARELATGIPEELRAPAAQRALDEAQITSRRLEGELKAAQDESITARENKVAAEGGAKAAAGTEVAAKRRVTTARKSFSAALGQHGFETAEAYEAAVIPEEDLLEAEDQVTTHRDALNGAKGQLKQARASVKEHPVQGDVDSFRERSLVAAAESREAQRLQNDADNRLASLKDARGALDELDEQFEEVTASYAIIGKLAEVAAGQSDGAKVSFQRWVLGRYLDDVLLAASRRLVTMSSDRYRLQRQKEASDLRRPSGLELAVFDGWSNRARPAITLSGGESFLAALSLALGLAETVQEQSGATPLETIFVDEGFGALDQNALEQAMDALTELKDSGRLVGVITHVPELRQVIDARLEVRGGPGGSSTQFFVP